MKFNSKIDLFYLLTTLIGLALCLVVPIVCFGFVVWYLCVYLVFALFVLFHIFYLSYTLNDNGLLIKSGFVKIVIDYDKIFKIEKTKSIKSSCASAIKCLEIRYSYKSKKEATSKIFISPRKENEFLNVLSMKCKNAKVVNKRR